MKEISKPTIPTLFIVSSSLPVAPLSELEAIDLNSKIPKLLFIVSSSLPIVPLIKLEATIEVGNDESDRRLDEGRFLSSRGRKKGDLAAAARELRSAAVLRW